MLSQFGIVLIFIAGGILFLMATFTIAKLLRPHKPNPQKLTPYESGEQPIGSSWQKFNIKYYTMALLFVLFEAELIFIFPWATIYADAIHMSMTSGMWAWFTLFEMGIFIAVLATGLIYAWAKGHLEWIKIRRQSTDYKQSVPDSVYADFNKKY
ncbi:MAG: NADH-quinone oxidoreductase subunit A [Cytophagales bacterium]|nr:NADH-quinone oxidoreductase subunit A [Cytophagales bacterium]